MPENTGRLAAQLRSASGRRSKLLKDADGIEAVVEVPGRGTLTLSVRRGAGTRFAPVPRRTPRETKPRDALWWRWG